MKKYLLLIILVVILTACVSEQKTNNLEARGIEKYKKYDYRGALVDFDKHIEQNPKDTSAYLYRASAKAMLNDYKGSLIDNSKAIELDSTSQLALYNRALDKTELEDNQGAINDLTTLINLKPDNLSEIYQKRGSIKQQMYDDKGAINDLSKAIELDPTNTDAYVSRALVNMDNTKVALIDLNKAIEIDKQKGSAYFTKGIIQLELNNNTKACNNLEKAISLNYEPAKSYYEKFCSNSSQEYFITQKVELYKTNYLNAPNNAIKSKFLDQSKTLTKKILDSLNYSILNWEGEVDMVMLGNKPSDIKLLKQGLTPNQVKENDPNNRPLSIIITLRKKADNGSYSITLIQEQNKNYKGGIKSSNPLYDKALNLKKGEKIKFSAKVKRIEEFIKNQEHSTIFIIELTNLK